MVLQSHEQGHVLHGLAAALLDDPGGGVRDQGQVLVREVVEQLAEWRELEEHTLVSAEEKMVFKLPRQLVD